MYSVRLKFFRKAKHHFANVLETGHVTSSLGVEVSLARRGIIFLLHSSGKDQELVQVGQTNR